MGLSAKKHIQFKKFYQNYNVVQRVDRRCWNKAIDLIDGKSRIPRGNPYCTQSTQNVVLRRWNKKNKLCTIPTMSSEIRHAILRHDWKSVCRLVECLVEQPRVFGVCRAIINKAISILLLSSPQSTPDIFNNFCSMALGLVDDQIGDFHTTIRHLPSEIPHDVAYRTHAGFRRRGENGSMVQSDYYVRALQHATEQDTSSKQEEAAMEQDATTDEDQDTITDGDETS